MTITQLIQICAKEGIGAIAVIGGIWLLFYLVKHTVVRLGSTMDKISSTLERLEQSTESRGKYVREEHLALLERHKEVAEQHKEMIISLGRINGYKT